MQLIGIAGLAGSGKTSAAQWFGTERGAWLAAFADPIKDAVCRIFGLQHSVFQDRDSKEAPLPGLLRSPRYLAQTLGTEWGRNLVHPDVWIMALQTELDSHFKIWGRPSALIVVHDMRFENEAKWVRDNGGTVLHIERDDRKQPVGVENHMSEAGIKPQADDVLIKNNGTLEQLGIMLEAAFPEASA